MLTVRRILCIISVLTGAVVLPAGGAFGGSLPDFTSVVAKVSPVVVNVSTTQRPDILAEDDGLQDQSDDNPYPDWYRRYFGAAPPESGSEDDNNDGDNGENSTDTPTESLGSGFVISANGEILTNYHVVENAQSVSVKLNDRRVFPAKILGMDPQSDLALLKIKAKDLPVAVISHNPVSVGQWVLAIGSPFGFDHSVTAGIVSAEGRSIEGEEYVPYIQTDVPINPGNSGGPLFNLQGQVVGINSEIYSRTGGYQGLSFAIPITLAMKVVNQLQQKGHVTRGWLGVDIVDVQPELAAFLHLSRPEGALVRKVAPASPAARAGLRVGDVILSYNGMNVVSSEALPPLVGNTAVGLEIPLVVLRDGSRTNLRVRIGVLPASATDQLVAADVPQGSGFDALGLAIRSLTSSERRQFKLKQGGVVVDEVVPGPAARAGFKPGDVVLAVNGTRVTGPLQFRQLEKQLPTKYPAPVLVQRPDETLFLPLATGGG